MQYKTDEVVNIPTGYGSSYGSSIPAISYDLYI